MLPRVLETDGGARHGARGARERAVAYQITMRLRDGRPIFTSANDRRVLARIALHQGERRGLMAFGVADNHVHAQVATSREEAGAFALYVASALRARLHLAARFDRAWIEPARDQWHAYRTFHYVIRQDARHDLGLDPAHDGSSLPEMLGLRAIAPWLCARVRALMPRMTRERLASLLPGGALDAEVPIDLGVLADAAAAALALPELRGRTPDVVRARRAAVHAAGVATPSARIAECLEVGVRAVQALRAQPQEEALVAAVCRQARLRAVLRLNAAAG